MDKPLLYIIAGPTASGKTAEAIRLAHEINGEIVSADSMQIYQDMDIGTAKPTAEEMQGIPHHMLGVVHPTQPYTVSDYSHQATVAIQDILRRGKTPILCGGTGFYINAIIRGTFLDTDESIYQQEQILREEFTLLAAQKGADHIHALLAEKDPQYAATLHPNNVKKVVRALSYCHATGKLFSAHNQAQKEAQSSYDTRISLLSLPREELYARINARVHIMWEHGLPQEVQSLLEQGVNPACTAMQGIGYKEVIPYLQSRATKDETIAKIQQATRNYAKRQETWFRHQL